jgi:arylsulfatase A-like enzyme
MIRGRRASGAKLAAVAGIFALLLPQPFAAAAAAPAQKVVGRTLAESSPPVWPQPVRAPAGAPNVLIIMTDDVGFGASSTFGGPIPTPTLDALAREGLRYNRFHTTAICSPTRASLLTGRDPQAVEMGYVANWATGYDGHSSVIPKSAGTMARILRDAGYNTAMFGKAHVTPEWEMSQAGPFDRWPTGLGFEYYYGFLGADTSQYEPNLVENTRPVTSVPNSPDYHLDRDLADRAIQWIGEQQAAAPDKPFFVYLAPGTAHAPNHAPDEWLRKFRGKFDQGWEALRSQIVERQRAIGVIPENVVDVPRPETLPRWDSLPPEKKRLYARHMEAYAASLAFADFQIGRVIDSLKASGDYDNTLIIFIQGDNGASAEGSFDGKLYEQSPLSGIRESIDHAYAHIDEIGTRSTYSLYPGGWGWALNAPFKWAKRYASHFGGVRNGMVLSWPGRVRDPGATRDQFMHVSDVMPTVLDIAGVQPPPSIDGVAQQPITGISMRYTIAEPGAASRRTTQVSAVGENASLYQDGWVVATTPAVTPWETSPPPPVAFDDRKWELYNVAEDFNQSRDLAAIEPRRLERMKATFWAQAGKAGLLPIHSSEGRQQGRPDLHVGRSSFVYTAPLRQLAETSAPPVVGRSFVITADIEVPEGGASGVLAAHGGRFGGYSLFLRQGRPAFTFNITPAHVTRLVGDQPLGPGRHRLTLRFTLVQEKPASPANVILEADGRVVGRARVERTFPLVVSHTEGFDVGQDSITSVDDSYTSAGSAFTGKLNRIEVATRPHH